MAKPEDLLKGVELGLVDNGINVLNVVTDDNGVWWFILYEFQYRSKGVAKWSRLAYRRTDTETFETALRRIITKVNGIREVKNPQMSVNYCDGE